VLGQLPPLSGELRWGAKVQIGYYAQQLEDLDDRNEIIMELRRVAPASASAGELRSFLAKFLFVGDDVYKQVGDLSGGEKGRLSLAKLIYSRVNVLVLDEPTNHLDIPSREALEEALDAFEGTIITISHDRYFLDRVATQILALDGDGNIEHYNGDYTEFHDWKAGRSESRQVGIAGGPGRVERRSIRPAVAGGPKPKSARSASADSSRRGKGKSGPASAGASRVKIIKKPRSPQVIEAEIAELEKRIADLSQKMSEPEVARDITRLVSANDEYQQTETRLAELMDEWERAEATARPSQR